MTRSASILLEVLLAIALFAFAGVVILGVMEETVASGARAQRRSLAMDLARSRMAELEVGIDSSMDEPETGGAQTGLRATARLEPSDLPDLQLVTVEVWDDAAPQPTALASAMGSTASTPRLAVLRQLMRTGAAVGAKAAAATRPPAGAPK